MPIKRIATLALFFMSLGAIAAPVIVGQEQHQPENRILIATPSSVVTATTTTRVVPPSTTTTVKPFSLEDLRPAVQWIEGLPKPTTTTHTHRPTGGGRVSGTHANNPLPPSVTQPVYRPVRVGGRWCSRGCIPATQPCRIPAYICGRESGLTIDIYNPTLDASGKYQFIRSTWKNFRGYRNAADSPESVQDEYATLLWAGGRGCSHWSAC